MLGRVKRSGVRPNCELHRSRFQTVNCASFLCISFPCMLNNESLFGHLIPQHDIIATNINKLIYFFKVISRVNFRGRSTPNRR